MKLPSSKLVPNSNIPKLVQPPDPYQESSILKNRMVKVGSTTSSELDKNILHKMKEFEAIGEQLFGVQAKSPSPSVMMRNSPGAN